MDWPDFGHDLISISHPNIKLRYGLKYGFSMKDKFVLFPLMDFLQWLYILIF